MESDDAESDGEKSDDEEGDDKESDGEKSDDEKSDEETNNGDSAVEDVEVQPVTDSRAELSALKIWTLKSIGGKMNLCTDTVESELVNMIINERDRLNIKYHRKRENPTKYTIPLSKWKEKLHPNYGRLPFDIDGLVRPLTRHMKSIWYW